MSDTMDMPPPPKIPTEGWVMIILTLLGAKPLWDHLTARKRVAAAAEREAAEHSQEIDLRKIDAAEVEDRKLIRVLEGQIKEMRGEIGSLRKEVGELRDERTQDKIVIATQAGTITAQAAEIKAKDERIAKLERDNERLRTEREEYRAIAKAGEGVAERTGHTSAARQLGDEISAADEANSWGGKAP